jgi:hypothetical protein
MPNYAKQVSNALDELHPNKTYFFGLELPLVILWFNTTIYGCIFLITYSSPAEAGYRIFHDHWVFVVARLDSRFKILVGDMFYYNNVFEPPIAPIVA